MSRELAGEKLEWRCTGVRKCLRLQGAGPSRSFAGMRVEAVGELPKRLSGTRAASGEAAASLAIKNFLAAIESDDSLFCVSQPLAGPSPEESSSGRVCSGDIVIEFRQSEYSSNRSLHFLLIEKLIELLKEAGSANTLEATLCLTSGSISVSHSESEEKSIQKQLAMGIRLAAKGESAEQAVLRWGLGLAHIQQALLFTSRHLRMYLAQANG
jgi:hypothetical protein